MPRNRKLLGAAAFSLALAGGGAAGAVLGTPALSGAQDDDTMTTEAPDTAPPPRFGGHRGELLSAAAEALGIAEDDLRAALAEGQSLADVATANEVDLQVVIDALVAQATERLEEIEAALPERMAELVEKEDWGEGRRHRHRLHHLGEGGPAEDGAETDATADADGAPAS